MDQIKDEMIGKTFNKWTVLDVAPSRNHKKYYKCQCVCGTVSEVNGTKLRNGESKRCRFCSHRKDVTNQRFGKLVALYPTNKTNSSQSAIWMCQCDCGKLHEVGLNDLQSGKIKSCGCSRKNASNKINLIGQRFGKLTVLYELEERDKNGGVIWACQCDCGNITNISGRLLRSGNTTSCGCTRIEKLIQYNKEHKKIDITNQRFGLLIAIKPLEKRRGKKIVWLCKCDCGNFTEVTGTDLRSGNTKSCGCMQHKSYGENKIQSILLANNIDFIKEYKNNECRFEDTNNLARFDFYLPQYNTIIEYDGIQHTISGKGQFDTPEKLQQTKQHDAYKNQWCKNHSICLIRIPYTHYDNIVLEDLLPDTSNYIIS